MTRQNRAKVVFWNCVVLSTGDIFGAQAGYKRNRLQEMRPPSECWQRLSTVPPNGTGPGVEKR